MARRFRRFQHLSGFGELGGLLFQNILKWLYLRVLTVELIFFDITLKRNMPSTTMSLDNGKDLHRGLKIVTALRIKR